MSDSPVTTMEAAAVETDEALGRLQHAAHDVLQLGRALAERRNPAAYADLVQEMQREPGYWVRLQIGLIGKSLRVEGLIIRSNGEPMMSLFEYQLSKAVRQ